VIIRYLDVPGGVVVPPKANSKLVVDANTLLALPISMQFLEAIARWKAEILEPGREIDDLQLTNRDPRDVSESPASASEPEILCLVIAE
jgi:hypothetical protein